MEGEARSSGYVTGWGGKGCPGDWWKPSTRSSRQEQRCHRVVWLISRFESSGVVFLVIPRGARRDGKERETEREREREGGRGGLVRACRKSGGVRTRGCAMRGRECRWRSVGETFGVDGGWLRTSAGACNWVPCAIATLSTPLCRPLSAHAVYFPYLDLLPPRPMEAGISPLCVNPVASSPTLRRSRHPVVPLSDSSPVLARSRVWGRIAFLCICTLASTRKTTTTTTATTTMRSRRAPSSTGDTPVKCVSACLKLMETTCQPSAHIPKKYHDGHAPDQLEYF